MVKQSKEHFEKMKQNLMEKIEMVSASRCNLLSHTLPSYQTEMLQYLDQAATELHKLLVDLRAQTQHQYKVKKFMEEIRVLESEEPQLDSPSTSTASTSEDDKEKTVTGGEQAMAEEDETAIGEEKVAEKPLIDMLQDELVIEPPYPPPTTLGGDSAFIPPPEQQQATVEEKETNVASHQSGMDEVEAAEPTAESEMARLMELLATEDQPTTMSESTDTGGSVAGPPPSSSADKWEQFSAFMDTPSTNEPDHSGWEKELLQSSPQASSLPPELEDLFATDSQLDTLVPQGSPTLAAPNS